MGRTCPARSRLGLRETAATGRSGVGWFAEAEIEPNGEGSEWLTGVGLLPSAQREGESDSGTREEGPKPIGKIEESIHEGK